MLKLPDILQFARVCNRFYIHMKETSKASNTMLSVLINSYSERCNDRVPFSGSSFIVKREKHKICSPMNWKWSFSSSL